MSSVGTVNGGTLAIEQLQRAGETDHAAIDSFLQRHDFPLAEGTFCTFVFRGNAHAVRLRHWIYGLPSSQPFMQLPKTDLWYLTLELPEGSRFEYKIEVAEPGGTRLIKDPLNPKLAHDPYGANSVCHATGYATPEWTQTDPEVREGWLEQRVIESSIFGNARSVNLYFPHRYRPERRYPLLVVHDGSDYLQYSALKTVLDNLIHRLEIPGLIVALTDPGHRLEEYAASEIHAQYLTEELVPQLERELPLLGTPGSRCLMGASLGAVAAFHAATQRPDFYGKLLLQSGAFAFSDIGDHERGPVFDDIAKLVNAFRRKPSLVSRRVFASCGMYESLIYENRSLMPVLQRAGMNVRYAEARDGHNWENWRDRLREGLSWLHPGPLWMVYE